MGGAQSSISGSSEDASAGEEVQAARLERVDQESPTDVSKLPPELTSKYEVLEKIGSGSFGSVYKVRRLDSRVLYAAKYVETKDSTATEVSWSVVCSKMC